MIDAKNYAAIRKEVYFSENFFDVLQELKTRSENKDLASALNKYWLLHELPGIDLSGSNRYAILSRSAASPNVEQKHFLDIAKKNNLIPVILEYDGKLVTRNPEKFFLCKMHFFTDKHNHDYIQPKKIAVVDINAYQGKNMSQVLTRQNTSLLDLHHDLFYKYADAATCNIHNFTHWFNATRKMGTDYYFLFLLMFMSHAVLFDNYVLSDPSEADFVEHKVLPSIRKIQEEFGLKPLIFPLVPIENEMDMRWLSYEAQVQEEVKQYDR